MIAGLKTHARLAAILAASAILIAVAAIALPPLTQGEEPMATPTATRSAAIPETAVQPPAVVETATFAMG
jgi:hypothetical protein